MTVGRLAIVLFSVLLSGFFAGCASVEVPRDSSAAEAAPAEPEEVLSEESFTFADPLRAIPPPPGESLSVETYDVPEVYRGNRPEVEGSRGDAVALPTADCKSVTPAIEIEGAQSDDSPPLPAPPRFSMISLENPVAVEEEYPDFSRMDLPFAALEIPDAVSENALPGVADAPASTDRVQRGSDEVDQSVDHTNDEPLFRELPVTVIRLTRIGITIPVALPGFGWIYLPEVEIEGYEYAGRNLTESGSVFSFSIKRPGDYRLRFQRQNSADGTFEIAPVELLGSGVTQGELPAVEENPTDQTAETTGAAGDAEEMSEAELLQQVRTSLEHRNFRGIVEMLDAAGATGKTTLIGNAIPSLLNDSVFGDREDYLGLSDILVSSDYPGVAATVLQAMLERFSHSRRDDEAYFRLASIYEMKSEIRDERRAHAYYATILENYPMSKYFERSEERKNYIERHYIDIR